jgi:hypothetical protein
MSKQKYRVGQMINGVLLLKKLFPRDKNHSSFKVRMPWGEERLIRTTTFPTQMKQFKLGIENNTALKCLFNTYRQGAKRRGIAWELTLEQFKNATSSNCHYCDAVPKQKSYIGKRKKFVPYLHEYRYNGIDRKDNSRGYIEDNCVPCCSSCNYIKGWVLNEGEMMAAMKAIKEYRKQRENINEKAS